MRAGRRRRWPGPPSPFLHRPGEMLMPHALAGSGSCMRKESRMRRTALAALAAAALAGAGLLVPGTAAGAPARHGYEPVLNPADFVHSITNPYFPFPVGRTLIYRGVRDGVTQTDSVHVTSQTRVLEGITAVVVSDVATHNGKLLEKTTDYYAQDKQGNVWYLGERTAAFSGGHVDHSGSWQGRQKIPHGSSTGEAPSSSRSRWCATWSHRLSSRCSSRTWSTRRSTP